MRPDERFRSIEPRPPAGRDHDPWWRPRPDDGTPDAGPAGPEGLAGAGGWDAEPLDRDLEPIAAELEVAGSRARARSTAAAPDPAFAAALRSRLLAAWPAEAEDPQASTDQAADLAAPLPHRAVPAGSGLLLRREAALAASGDGHATRVGPIAGQAGGRTAAGTSAVRGARVRLAPRLAVALPAGRPTRRWGVLAMVAALAIAVVGLESRSLFPGRPPARSADAVGATLIRDGAEMALRPGTELVAGDLVRVAAGGHALLDLAAGQARLAPGATIRLAAVAGDRIRLEQLAGRAYHRVVMSGGGTYEVATGGMTWTARGTAFDLERSTAGPDSASPGEEIIREMSVEHDVRVAGAGLSATIAEGRVATIAGGGGTPALTLRAVTAGDVADPWLIANARRDAEAGLPLGIMAGVALASPVPSPSLLAASPSLAASAPPSDPPAATAEPVSTDPSLAPPDPTAGPTPTPRPTPKPSPTPSPTPTAIPTPTPAPTLGALTLSLVSCEGRFAVATWSKWPYTGFNHYQGLRGSTSSIPTTYPPGGGVTAPAGLYSNVATTNTGVDQGLTAGSTYWYRAVAYDAADQALAASPAGSILAKAQQALGPLGMSTTGPSSTSFTWTAYAGNAACFTYYKLVYSATDPSPSYLKGSPYLWVGSIKTDSIVTIDAIAPGTYWFKLEAVRSTSQGNMVAAATDVTQFTVP